MFITSLDMASASWRFCCSDLPGQSLTITWGIVLSCWFLGVQQHLDRAAFVHRPVGVSDLAER